MQNSQFNTLQRLGNGGGGAVGLLWTEALSGHLWDALKFKGQASSSSFSFVCWREEGSSKDRIYNFR